jgi:hypothetical protein
MLCGLTSLLHCAVEGPVADHRTFAFMPSCCCWLEEWRGELWRRGGRRRGRLPGAARSWPRGAARWSCASAGPLPRAGVQLVVPLPRVACHCWGLTRACLRVLPGGRRHAVAARCGRPPVDACHRMCPGFRQCGSFVEVCIVDCVLSLWGWLVLVRGGCACCAMWEMCYPALTLRTTCGAN